MVANDRSVCEPCQQSKMELFKKNTYQLKSSIIDVWQGPKYTFKLFSFQASARIFS